MFYGAGAGKLPTASAVCADIIDIACNVNKNIPIYWDRDKLELNSFDSIKNDFFVRVADEDGQAAARVEKVFDEVEEIKCGMDKEYAYIIKGLSEGDFKALISKVDGVQSVIRIKK
jgi:homoserine dehydrogenase